jgi:ABC-type antimicrobial peptide transport system permease subunit
VVSYFVTMRRREIGIRLAIGATTGGIVRLIVRQCLGLAGGGAALGLALAFPIAAYMHATFVEKVDHLDPVVYAGPVALIALVAALAAALPARRAARVDPVATLRQD